MTLSDLLPHGYIDAHHHVWAPQSRADIGYGWLRDIGAMKPFGDPTPIQRDYLMEEFLAEAPLRPRASVHVQTDGALPDPVAETRFVQAEADRVGHDVAIIGLADLSSPELGALLERHGAYAGFKGVRQIVARLDHRPDLSFAPKDYLSDPAWCEGLKRLEDAGLTFDLQLYPEQAEAAMEALSATPALTVIIDHALCPYDPNDPVPPNADPDILRYQRWSLAVGLMAQRPNTYIKLSGWGMYAADWAEDGHGLVAQYIHEIAGYFGVNRMMWGSNYPVEKLASDYEAAIRKTADGLSDHAKKCIFYQSASEAYGLKLK